jgi:hypothetical protein
VSERQWNVDGDLGPNNDDVTTCYDLYSDDGVLITRTCDAWGGEMSNWIRGEKYLGTTRETTANWVDFRGEQWENDVGSRWTYEVDHCTVDLGFTCAARDSDDWYSKGNLEGGAVNRDPNMMGRPIDVIRNFPHDDVPSIRARYLLRVGWAFAHGSQKTDPLIFGDITDGKLYTHLNSTRAWYDIGASDGEQFYRFTVQEETDVVISTNYAETGSDNPAFDSKLTLFGRNQYNHWTEIGYNDDFGGTRNSQITQRLCPGTYLVQVEGWGGDEGNFKLSVQARNPAVLPTIGPLTGDKWRLTTYNRLGNGNLILTGWAYTPGSDIVTNRDLYSTTGSYGEIPGLQTLTASCSENVPRADNFYHVYERIPGSCGQYAIDINALDDDIQVIIDGEEVWRSPRCCYVPGRVWEGSLRADSKIEIRHEEYGGGAYLDLRLVPIAVENEPDSEWRATLYEDGSNTFRGYARPIDRGDGEYQVGFPLDPNQRPDFEEGAGTYFESYQGCGIGVRRLEVELERTGVPAGIYRFRRRTGDLFPPNNEIENFARQTGNVPATLRINGQTVGVLMDERNTYFNPLHENTERIVALGPDDVLQLRSHTSNPYNINSWHPEIFHRFSLKPVAAPQLNIGADRDRVVACSATEVRLSGQSSQNIDNTAWQWQQSTDAQHWTDLADATATELSVANLSQSTYYRFTLRTADGQHLLASSPARLIQVTEVTDPALAGNWSADGWYTMAYGNDDWTDPVGTTQLNSMHVNLEQLMGGPQAAPQQLPNYTGCDRDADYWSLRMRRRGFTPGTYRLSLGYYLDDDFYLLHDANADGVWEDSIYVNGWTYRNHQAPSVGARFSQQLSLTASSRVEVRFVDRTGAARMDMRLDPVPQLTLATDRSQLSHCDNQTAEVTLTHDHPGGDYELRWFDWRNGAAHQLTDQQGTSRTVHPAGETQWYRVDAWADDGTLLSQSGWLSVETLDDLSQDPASEADFGGSGEWSIATYNDLKMQQPRARARHGGGGFLLRDFTDAQGSPANLPDYAGCATDPTGGWSLRMRRSGFTTDILAIYLEIGVADEELLWRIDDDGDGVYDEEISLKSGGKSGNPNSRYLERAVGPTTVVDVLWNSRSNTNGLRMEFGEAAAALPVELVTFTARAAGDHNLLEWATATEQDNEAFYVERSADGEHFVELGRVDGAGTSRQLTPYRYADAQPLTAAYYRLRQQDFDGTISYSDIVYLEREEAGPALELKLFPNPATSYARLITTQEGYLRVVHTSGRVIREQRLLAGTTRLDVSRYPPGVYWLDFTSGSDRRRLKLIRHR